MDNFVNSLMDEIIKNRNKPAVSEELPLPPETNNNTSEQFLPPDPPATSDNNIVKTPTKEEEKEEGNKDTGIPESQEPSLSKKENTPIIAEIIHSILNQIQTPSANKPNNDFDQKKDTISQNILISNIIQSILNQISNTTPKVEPKVEVEPTPNVEAVSDRPLLPTVSNIEGSIIEGLVRPHINIPFRTNQQFTIKPPKKSNTVASVVEGVIQPSPINTNTELSTEVTPLKKDNDTDNTVSSVIESIIRPNNIISGVPGNKEDVQPTAVNPQTENYTGNKNVKDLFKNTIGNIIIISDNDFMKIENTFKKLQDRASNENV